MVKKTTKKPVKKLKGSASPVTIKSKPAKTEKKKSSHADKKPLSVQKAGPAAADGVETKAGLALKPEKTTRASSQAAESLSKLTQKWNSLFKKASGDAIPYSISGTFEAKTPIMHKILGWGYVLANKNDRLEVLFRDGIKYLISNYKRD